MRLSSSGTSLTILTTSLGALYICTSAGRRVARVDSLISKREVRWIDDRKHLYARADLTSVIQILMQATNGLGVILENRYYGESYPFESSTTDELRFLTTEQSKCGRLDPQADSPV